MKRRILLVDDEVAVLLTLKAVLEISGFDVDTAASAREGKLKLRQREYSMVITDMRMERESSGRDVIAAARAAAYKPAIALLTAFPVSDDSWEEVGADKMLVKPMQTRVLLQQIEKLFASHEAKKAIAPQPTASAATPAATQETPTTKPAKKSAKKSAKKTAKAAKTAVKVAKKAAKTVSKSVALKKPAKTIVASKNAVKKLATKKPVKLAKAKPVKKSAKKTKSR